MPLSRLYDKLTPNINRHNIHNEKSRNKIQELFLLWAKVLFKYIDKNIFSLLLNLNNLLIKTWIQVRKCRRIQKDYE